MKRAILLSVLMIGALAATPKPASAGVRFSFGFGYPAYFGGFGVGFGGFRHTGFVVGVAPYYAPAYYAPPVYYSALAYYSAPAYYAPPAYYPASAYYAPAPYYYGGVGFPLFYGYGGHFHGGHYHR